jgi:hypothetical protein
MFFPCARCRLSNNPLGNSTDRVYAVKEVSHNSRILNQADSIFIIFELKFMALSKFSGRQSDHGHYNNYMY